MEFPFGFPVSRNQKNSCPGRPPFVPVEFPVTSRLTTCRVSRGDRVAPRRSPAWRPNSSYTLALIPMPKSAASAST